MHKRLREEIEARLRLLKDMRDHSTRSHKSAKFGSVLGQIASLEWVLREDQQREIEHHNRAFELAKKKAGVTDLGSLTSRQLSDLCTDAEQIRRTELTQEAQIVKINEPSDSAREPR